MKLTFAVYTIIWALYLYLLPKNTGDTVYGTKFELILIKLTA